MSHFFPSEKTVELLERIGRNLRIARKRRHKTIAEAAEMVGVSSATIKRIEHGDSSVKFAVYLALAEVFQMAESISFAEPENDAVGLTLEKQRLPERVRKKKDQRLEF